MYIPSRFYLALPLFPSGLVILSSLQAGISGSPERTFGPLLLFCLILPLFLSDLRRDLATRPLRKARDKLLQCLSDAVGSDNEYLAREPHGSRELFVEAHGSPKWRRFRTFVIALIWEESETTAHGFRVFQHATQCLVRHGDGCRRATLITSREIDHEGRFVGQENSFGHLLLQGSFLSRWRSWSKTPPSLRYASLEELQDLTTMVKSWTPADDHDDW